MSCLMYVCLSGVHTSFKSQVDSSFMFTFYISRVARRDKSYFLQFFICGNATFKFENDSLINKTISKDKLC